MSIVRNACQLLIVLLMFACVTHTRADSYSDALKVAGIESDRDSLAKYLRKFQPTEEEQKLVAQLIRELGDDDYFVREAATAKIKALPVLPRGALDRAAQSNDAEVKWRSQSLLKQGNDQEQVLLLAAMKVIDRQKHKGLLAELLAVYPFIAGNEGRTACKRAIASTVATEDVARLRSLLKHEDAMLRAAGVMGLSATLGSDAAADVKPLLKDGDESVQLIAARTLGDIGDRDCLETYLKLLESKHEQIRWEALASLRWLSGKTMRIDEEDETKRRARMVQAWREWIANEGKTAALKFPIQIADRIELFNGIDLSGWQAVNNGQPVSGKDVWSVKDGILVCNGQGSGYLRTKRSFLNYELSVDWRWPTGAGVGRGGAGQDSGVWIMLSGADANLPKGLEAQLGAGNAGDFWTLSGFQCKVKGQEVQGLGKKFAPSSEKPMGEWNTITIRVQQGTVTVKVNGVEQNIATDCPREPGCIALQVEGHAIDFRNVSILPLED